MAKARDPNQSEEEPRRRNWVDAVSIDARTAGNAAFVRAGFRDATLVMRWEEIVGHEVARLATPIKLTDGPHGAVLTLKAEPGGALFLQHETRSLCERINAYLGRPAVAKLRFVQGPLIHRPPPPPRRGPAPPISKNDAAVSFSGPDKVKDALINLARARRIPPTSD